MFPPAEETTAAELVRRQADMLAANVKAAVESLANVAERLPGGQHVPGLPITTLAGAVEWFAAYLPVAHARQVESAQVASAGDMLAEALRVVGPGDAF